MAAKLVFDVGAIHDMSQQIKKLEEEICKQNNELMENLEKLREDWNTPAGKKFFKSVDLDWQDEVEDYCKTLEVMSEMLNEAAARYTGLQDEIGSLKLG